MKRFILVGIFLVYLGVVAYAQLTDTTDDPPMGASDNSTTGATTNSVSNSYY